MLIGEPAVVTSRKAEGTGVPPVGITDQSVVPSRLRRGPTDPGYRPGVPNLGTSRQRALPQAIPQAIALGIALGIALDGVSARPVMLARC